MPPQLLLHSLSDSMVDFVTLILPDFTEVNSINLSINSVDQDHTLLYVFVCLCSGFMAQSTNWGHVERGQFT